MEELTKDIITKDNFNIFKFKFFNFINPRLIY